MHILKNLLKSTVFVGGALGAMPVMATTATFDPAGSASFSSVFNNNAHSVINFSSAGTINFATPLSVTRTTPITIDASSLVDYTATPPLFFPVVFQSNNSDGQIFTSTATTPPQITLKGIDLRRPAPTLTSDVPLNLNYPGQLNLVNSRVVSPAQVNGSGTVALAYDRVGDFNVIGFDASTSSSTQELAVNGGTVVITKVGTGDLRGGSALAGFDLVSGQDQGSLLHNAGTLVIDASVLKEEIPSDPSTSNTGPLFFMQNLTLKNDTTTTGPKLTFQDSDQRLIAGLTTVGGSKKFPLATVANAPTLPTGAITFDANGKRYTAELTTEDNGSGKKVFVTFTLQGDAPTPTPGPGPTPTPSPTPITVNATLNNISGQTMQQYAQQHNIIASQNVADQMLVNVMHTVDWNAYNSSPSSKLNYTASVVRITLDSFWNEVADSRQNFQSISKYLTMTEGNLSAYTAELTGDLLRNATKIKTLFDTYKELYEDLVENEYKDKVININGQFVGANAYIRDRLNVLSMLMGRVFTSLLNKAIKFDSNNLNFLLTYLKNEYKIPEGIISELEKSINFAKNNNIDNLGSLPLSALPTHRVNFTEDGKTYELFKFEGGSFTFTPPTFRNNATSGSISGGQQIGDLNSVAPDDRGGVTGSGTSSQDATQQLGSLGAVSDSGAGNTGYTIQTVTTPGEGSNYGFDTGSAADKVGVIMNPDGEGNASATGVVGVGATTTTTTTTTTGATAATAATGLAGGMATPAPAAPAVANPSQAPAATTQPAPQAGGASPGGAQPSAAAVQQAPGASSGTRYTIQGGGNVSVNQGVTTVTKPEGTSVMLPNQGAAPQRVPPETASSVSTVAPTTSSIGSGAAAAPTPVAPQGVSGGVEGAPSTQFAQTLATSIAPVTALMQRRLRERQQALMVAPDHSGRAPVVLAALNFEKQVAKQPLVAQQKDWSAWLAPHGYTSRSKPKKGQRSEASGQGAEVGGSYKFAPQWTASLSGSMVQTRSHGKNRDSLVRGKLYAGMAALSWTPDAWSFNLAGFGGPLKNHLKRRFKPANVSYIRATSKGHQMGGAMRASYGFKLGEYKVSPGADFRYIRINTDTYKERRGGRFNMKYKSFHAGNWSTGAGVNFGRTFNFEQGNATFDMGLRWMHRQQANKPRMKIITQFKALNNGVIIRKNKTRKMDNVAPSLMGSYAFTNGVTLGVNYSGEFGRYMRQHAGGMRLSYAF